LIYENIADKNAWQTYAFLNSLISEKIAVKNASQVSVILNLSSYYHPLLNPSISEKIAYKNAAHIPPFLNLFITEKIAGKIASQVFELLNPSISEISELELINLVSSRNLRERHQNEDIFFLNYYLPFFLESSFPLLLFSL
jgi:hypothetical protein